MSNTASPTCITNILSGRLDDIPNLPPRTLKVFVCSNKSDFELERSILWKDVVPDIQYHCTKYGLDLVWIDLHHGSETDYVHDTHSFQSHLSCMEDCAKEFAFPIFLCLIGNRYGDSPLPFSLDESEFRHIRSEAFEGGKDIKMLDDWYIKDDNTFPPIYRLRRISEKFTNFYRGHDVKSDNHQLDVEAWSYSYETLLDMIQYGAQVAHSEGHINQVHLSRQERFFSSGLEQEMHIARKLSTKNMIAIHRSIESIYTSEVVDRTSYIDVKLGTSMIDSAKRTRLEQFKMEFESVIPDSNKFNFSLSWKKGLQTDLKEHVQYIESFTAAVATKIRDLLDNQQKRALNFPPSKKGCLITEALVHLNHCKNLFLVFSSAGTETILSEVQMLLLKGSKMDHQAIIIQGSKGCGKSVFISKVCNRARELFGKETLLVVRFIGLTPQSLNSQELLRSICMQLNLVLKQNISVDFYDTSLLTNYFHGLVNRISKGQRHLVIALDGIDRLDQCLQTECSNVVDWMNSKLPSKVHFIMTYTPGDKSLIVRKTENRYISQKNVITFPTWNEERYRVILKQNLSRSKKELTPKQESGVVNILTKGSPSNMDLITQKVKNWSSKQDINDTALHLQHTDSVGEIIDSLQTKFGILVIETICLYITLSQFGVSEMELLDLLSNNNEILIFVFRNRLPTVLRFPFILWLQIKHDFGILLCHRMIHGKSVMRWSNDAFSDVIKKRFCKQGETLYNIQNDIAQLFLEAWVEGKPFKCVKGNIDFSNSERRMICPQPLLYNESTYNLRRLHEMWMQLLLSGQIQSFKEHAMCNFEYLLAIVHSSSIKVLLRNMKTVLSKLLDADILLIYNILVSSEKILLRYPTQLANELIGRLNEVKEYYSPHIDSLVTQCMQWCDGYSWPLFVPLTTWLPNPHVSHVSSMDQMDGCRVMVPLIKNQHVICSFGLQDLAMYHVPSKTLLKIFSGHRNTVRCLMVSKGGNMFVSGSDDNTARVWRIREGVCSAVIREHTGSVLCLVLTPKDDRLVSGSADFSIVVSNITTGKREHVLKGHSKAVTSLKLNSTGDILVSASRDGTIVLWCMGDKTKLGTIFDGIHSPIISMDISADNTFIIAGCEDSSLNVIAFTTGTFIHQLTGHKGWINKVSISKDGYHVVAGCQDCVVYLYNLRTTELLETYQGHKFPVIDIRISNDESLIYSLSEGRLNVWSFYKKNSTKSKTDAHKAPISSLAVTSDGKLALSGAENGEIKVWNLEASKFLENFSGHSACITCIEVSTDGAFMVTSSKDRTQKVWSMTLAIVITNYKKHNAVVYNMKVLDDDLRIISHDSLDNFQIWKADDGETLVNFTIQASIFTLSCDNKFLVTTNDEQSACIWQTETGVLLTSVTHTENVTCFVCDVNNRYLVTGSVDRSCKIWELDSGKLTQVLVEHDSTVVSVLITHDSQLVISNAEDGNIMVWGVKNGETKHKLIGHISKVTAMKLLSNEDFLVSASSDCTLRLWNIQHGRQITMIDIHTPVINLVISEDASRIALHLESSNKVPIICLHNSPCAMDQYVDSQCWINETNEDESILPIQPKMSLMHRNSFVFPVPDRPTRKSRSVSSIPQIIKLSPMRAPVVHKTKQFKRSHLRVSFKPTKDQRAEDKESRVCCIL